MPFMLSMKVGLPADQYMQAPEDEPAAVSLLDWSAEVKKTADGFRVVVRGFATKEEAADATRRLGAAIRIWASERLVKATVVTTVTPVNLFEPPLAVSELASREDNPFAQMMSAAARARGWSRIDGSFNESETVVYDDSLNLLISGGSASIQVGLNPQTFALCVTEALDSGVTSAALDDEKLSLVIDLAIAAHKEIGHRAKLFGLVSALEAMLEDEKKPEHVQIAIDAAADFLRQLEVSDKVSSDIKKLASDLGRLRWRSTASRVKMLLEKGLPETGPYGSRASVVREILKAQGSTRSKLIHGHVDPELQDLGQANQVITWSLARLIRHRLGLHGEPPLPEPPQN
jgi:hypothetical protein